MPRQIKSHASKVAVIIPCFNEALSIAAVIKKFKKSLPSAHIFVFDNNSTDGTGKVAEKAGAYVKYIKLKGKGHVVRRMFADIDADIYVMVDGDDTYEVEKSNHLVKYFMQNNLDMLVGVRNTNEKKAYRLGHRFGNWLITSCINYLFGHSFKDILSGFRVFSKRFVKTFPANSDGFEIETELTIHSLEMKMPIDEVDIKYFSRMPGSQSKLNSYLDGLKIIFMITRLFKEKKPLSFFTFGSFISILISIVLAIPIVKEFLITGLVPRFPTAILCLGLCIIGAILLVCGIILDEVSKNRRTSNYLHYLSFK